MLTFFYNFGMARLSWSEIEARAVKLAADWAGESYEKGDSQSFWTGAHVSRS